MTARKPKSALRPIRQPEYPRVATSGKRHVKLATEARKRGLDIREVAEEKFVLADKVAKRPPYTKLK